VSEVLQRISSGRVVVSSRSVNALAKLSALVLREWIKRGASPVVVDNSGVLARYLPLDVLGSVEFSTNLEEACAGGKHVLVYGFAGLRLLEKCAAKNIVVFTAPRSYYPKGYLVVYFSRVSSTLSEYVFKIPQEGLSIRVRLGEELRVVEKPPGTYGRAYEVLKSAMSDYGELTVKDAVRLISLELGVDKQRARNILVWLTRRKYFKVARGRLSLA
jgi:hypothetical protein